MDKYLFKISEPKNKELNTEVLLFGWRHIPESSEYVIQWRWKWLYRRGIESAKRKLIKQYKRWLIVSQPNKEWEETV